MPRTMNPTTGRANMERLPIPKHGDPGTTWSVRGMTDGIAGGGEEMSTHYVFISMGIMFMPYLSQIPENS